MPSRYFICYDTETTGLNRVQKKNLPRPSSISVRGSEVCQIGGITLDSNMRPVRLFCYYCDTVSVGSRDAALEVHKIDSREVRSTIPAIFLPEIMDLYLPEFFYPDSVFIGYNAMFDMDMVAQTLANSAIPFTYQPLYTQFIPRAGRHVIDVAEYVRAGSTYRKLVSFENELAPARELFLREYSGVLNVETNCVEMLQTSWNHAHNSFFDALNTYLLWREKIWKKKVI